MENQIDKSKKLIFKFLRINNYYLTKNRIKRELLSHPEFPSIKAITDTLDSFNIDNLAAQVSKDTLTKLPSNFLSVMNDGNINMVFKKSITIKLQPINGSQNISLDEFKKLWSGTIIAVEKKKFKLKHLKYYKKYIIVLLFCSLASFSFLERNPIDNTLILINFVGIIVSCLILRKEVGLNDLITTKLCNSNNSSIDCDSVISSSQGNLFYYF